MKITVSARHTDVSPALRAAAEAKLERLVRRSSRLSRIDRADVHFTEERNPRIAEPEVCDISIQGRGQKFWCKASGPDPFVAVDRATAKLEQQVSRAKTKVLRRDTGMVPVVRRVS